MSSYIKDFDYDLLKDEEQLEDYYEELEESDKDTRRKRYTKMRGYEGYGDNE